MKKAFVLVGGIFLTCAIVALMCGAFDRNAPIKTIAVNGECLTTAPKDKTAITLRVTTLANNAAESVRNATEQMSQITEYLKSQNISSQTTQFNSYEKTEWNREEQKSVTLGIETSIAVEVSANNIETIENVLAYFADKPNVFSENLRMYTSPEVLKPITEKCLTIAVENARERANALAAGDNKRAGKIINISFGTSVAENIPNTPSLMRVKSTAMGAAFDASGAIVAKDTDVAVSVNAIFEIK
ncbi:MAG: SIMPL domain-containing protein [Alphaproteobacteria bacterium]|nr:SIMPL domain-containing protein [Alphaproteobacteria bacterium]